jgi:hypothetical protein
LDFENLRQFEKPQTILEKCYFMVGNQKMAFTGRYLPKYIQIYFISAFENSLNSLPSETAVDSNWLVSVRI